MPETATDRPPRNGPINLQLKLNKNSGETSCEALVRTPTVIAKTNSRIVSLLAFNGVGKGRFNVFVSEIPDARLATIFSSLLVG
jgi:hypothetical protein